MNRSASLILAIALLGGATAYAAGWDAVESLSGAAPLRVLVQDRPRVYFRLTPAHPLEIPVDGPAKVRVVSRLALARGASGPGSYRLRLVAGGKVLKESRTESSPAPSAVLEGSTEVLCKSRTMNVDVPSGRQKLVLSIDGAASAVVRIMTQSPQRGAGESYVSLTPIAAPRSVTLSEGEKSIPYYTVVAGGPVKIRVVGPTSLEISTRLDFDATMRGTQRYRLSIRLNGQPARETSFATTKSTTAAYLDLKDRVPSKLDRTVLPIADGGHEVTIELLEPSRGSVEVHARIPQISVGNEE